MERAIALACHLGGDTDTIATMAAAICGAHVGFDAVPKRWLERCEDHEKRVKLAEKLYAMYKRHKNAKPKRGSQQGSSSQTQQAKVLLFSAIEEAPPAVPEVVE